jgi:hypothetical protein
VPATGTFQGLIDVGSCAIDDHPIALQDRCKTNRAANVRERNSLGDEQGFRLRAQWRLTTIYESRSLGPAP